MAVFLTRFLGGNSNNYSTFSENKIVHTSLMMIRLTSYICMTSIHQLYMWIRVSMTMIWMLKSVKAFNSCNAKCVRLDSSEWLSLSHSLYYWIWHLCRNRTHINFTVITVPLPTFDTSFFNSIIQHHSMNICVYKHCVLVGFWYWKMAWLA